MTTTASLPRAHAERARAFVERGRRCQAEGDVVRAREHFRRAMIHDTRHEEAHRGLVSTYDDSERTAHRFSVILPTWNRLAHLRHCLDSLRRNSFYSNEIVVIDNNSQDGTVDFLRAQTDIRVIFSPTEIPVVRAANLGLAAATGDIIGGLNDDVEVLPGWDLELAHTLTTERRVGVVTPTVIHTDGTLSTWGLCNPYTSFAYPWVGQLWHESQATGGWLADFPAFHTPRDCEFGPFPFFTRECFQRVGGLDEQYQHYYADADFGYRILEVGLRNVHCPTSLVIHLSLGNEHPQRTSERFQHDVGVFGAKWMLQHKADNAPAIRHSYLYFDRYYEHLRAERIAGSAADSSDMELADWLPASCRDILDIGSESLVADALRQRGAHVARVDATGRWHPDEPPPLVADMSFLPLGFTACDAIIARFALSRSCWPRVTLLEFNRVLDNGGHLLLTLPPYEEHWLQHPEHLSVFTEAQWRRAFTDAGFMIVRAETPEGGGGRSDQRYLLRKVRTLFVPQPQRCSPVAA